MGFKINYLVYYQNYYIKTFIENVQSEYTKVIGYEAAFFSCKSGDGVKEIINL